MGRVLERAGGGNGFMMERWLDVLVRSAASAGGWSPVESKLGKFGKSVLTETGE